MKKAIKIEDLPAKLDETAVQVLRIIALKLGDRARGRVEYMQIAASLNVKREVVRKAVNRLKRKRVLRSVDGELEILRTVDV